MLDPEARIDLEDFAADDVAASDSGSRSAPISHEPQVAPRTRRCCHLVTPSSHVSPSMTAVRRGLLLSLLCDSSRSRPDPHARETPPPTASSSRSSSASRRRRWRARARSLRVAACTRARSLSRSARPGDADRSLDPGSADPLALPARRERDGRRPAPLAARPAHVAPGRRPRLPERPLPHPARPQPAADRRAGALGARPDERRPGHEDRDHRRGDRPDAPALLAGRLHDARGLPQGPDRLHDREGDRRPRVPAGPPGLEARGQAVRSRVLLARDARRRDRGRQREHASPRAAGSRESRRARTWGTTRR